MEKALCYKLQYLIGVPARYIDNYVALNKGVLIKIRALCNLRSTLIANFREINIQFSQGKSLGDIKATARLVEKCAQCGVSIENKYSLSRNIIELNQLIEDLIQPISLGFKPLPAEWIQELFVMPNGDVIDGVRDAVRKYSNYKKFYPYQKYINWSFAGTKEEIRTKNIFQNDEILFDVLRERHRYKGFNVVDFAGMSGDAVVIIDCENVDAQRTYDALSSVKYWAKKIVFVNGTYTNRLWDAIIQKYSEEGIPIEHDNLPRIKDFRSLADLRIVAKTCEEFYHNNVQHFILVSSDSDIWALISSLPQAEIMLLTEKNHSGDALIETVTQHNIQHIFMDDFTHGSTELQDLAMHSAIISRLNTIRAPEIDFNRLVKDAAHMLNLYLDNDSINMYIQWAIEEATVEQTENSLNDLKYESFFTKEAKANLLEKDGFGTNDLKKYPGHQLHDTSILSSFFENAQDAVVIIESDNCFAQKTYAAVLPYAAHLKKIILIEDSYTSVMWEPFVHEFSTLGTIVERDKANRINEHKSLQGLRMVAKTCEEYYQNGESNFILVTSNSDVWAIISSLPNANIAVLAEELKCGRNLINTLEQHSVPLAIIKDNIEVPPSFLYDYMHNLIIEKLQTLIQNNIEEINALRVIVSITKALRLSLSEDDFEMYLQWTNREIIRLTHKENTDDFAKP